MSHGEIENIEEPLRRGAAETGVPVTEHLVHMELRMDELEELLAHPEQFLTLRGVTLPEGVGHLTMTMQMPVTKFDRGSKICTVLNTMTGMVTAFVWPSAIARSVRGEPVA